MTRRIPAICAFATLIAFAACGPKEADEAGEATPAVQESQTALMAEATITEAAASATAMKEVPGGKIESHELERENGKLIYSFDLSVADKEGIEEVNVDAMTGAMVAHEHETPSQIAKEKAADAKAAAKKKSGGN